MMFNIFQLQWLTVLPRPQHLHLLLHQNLKQPQQNLHHLLAVM